jgi:glycerol-3-phosphate acyltransferase PlsY
VLRTGKKAAAAFVLLGDTAKGWLVVWLAIKFCPTDVMYTMLAASVALAVFFGHLFPIFLKFKGGKGVATALGVLLALNVWVGVGALVTWLFMAVAFRYSSLAALAASIAAPIYAYLFYAPREWVFASGIMSLMLVWRHKSNIQNLLAGNETKLGGKKKAG